MTPDRPAFTTRQITEWLKRYRDWKARLIVGAGAAGSAPTGDATGVHGSGTSDPCLAAAVLTDELERRCCTVEGWLVMLSPLELTAAEYWLADDDGTFTAVAEAAGLEIRRVKALVVSIPLIIWGRFYDDRDELTITLKETS